MTDRINAITVVLDHDIRADDIERLIIAIQQLRWVLSVEPHVVAPADYIAHVRVRAELREKLLEVLRERWGDTSA